MNIKSKLFETKPRETGGEISLKGLDYQSAWAISEMLDYDLRDESYIFIFEYHDDILILIDEHEPKMMRFCQVKTANKNWTVNELTKISSKAPVSIIGKMYRHRIDFQNIESSLEFISNAHMSFTSANRCELVSLKPEEIQIIRKSIFEQVQGVTSVADVNINDIWFQTSSLSFEEHSIHLEGKVSAYLDAKFGPHHSVKPGVLTKALLHECRERAKFQTASLTSYNDIVDKKGISRLKFRERLSQYNELNNHEKWNSIEIILKAIGYEPIDLILAKSAFKRMSISDILDDHTVYKLKERAVSRMVEIANGKSLKDKFLELRELVREKDKDLIETQNDKALDCVIAIAFLDQMENGLWQ